MSNSKKVSIIGAGPAGLSAGNELSSTRQFDVTLYERTGSVGGISRTEEFKGYYFDIGGHRFFSKNDNINSLWREMLGPDYRKVSRLSRIFYNGKYLPYPLKFWSTITGLGFRESLAVCTSYLNAAFQPIPNEKTFEDWIINRFGRKLYHLFFKSYTEKVWGIPCNRIQAEWAAQRIQGLSFVTAVTNTLFGKNDSSKSLIEEFDYPTYGPGMMWSAFSDNIKTNGGDVLMNSRVVGLNHATEKITEVRWKDENGKENIASTDHVISSIPLKHLIDLLNPAPPPEITAAAKRLAYRAFIIVVLIIDKEELFPDQWIYIHSPDVTVGRIQNFKNWSGKMVPRKSTTSLGMEYFCDKNDQLWSLSEKNLTELAAKEIEQLGMSCKEDVLDSYVVRQEKAYPVYDENFKNSVAIIRDYLKRFDNLQTVGRNGTHRYNNMDHSMASGIKAALKIKGKTSNSWRLPDDEYLETAENGADSKS